MTRARFATERGPGAVPRRRVARRGGRYPVWAHAVAVAAARRLRCGARIARAAAMPLASGAPAPLLHGSSPVQPWRAGLPLVVLRFSPPHKSPTPGTAHRAAPLLVFDNACLGGAGKAVVGCAPAATSAAPSTAERMAARAQRALQRLTCVDCSSVANAVSAASFDAGHAIEERKGVGPSAPTAAHERRRAPGRGFASLGLGMRD